jgi:hypothetical protein
MKIIIPVLLCSVLAQDPEFGIDGNWEEDFKGEVEDEILEEEIEKIIDNFTPGISDPENETDLPPFSPDGES